MTFAPVTSVKIQEGSFAIDYTKTITVESSDKKEPASIPTATVNKEFKYQFTIADLLLFGMVSTRDLTVKTNSSGSPQETFVLLAGIPVTWELGQPAIFAGSVTTIFVSNSSGDAAVFKWYSGSTTP